MFNTFCFCLTMLIVEHYGKAAIVNSMLLALASSVCRLPLRRTGRNSSRNCADRSRRHQTTSRTRNSLGRGT